MLGVVVYRLVSAAIPEFGFLSASAPLTAATTVAIGRSRASTAGRTHVSSRSAALDYFIAQKRFAEDAKMSKQEVRDEHHDREGRPEVKVKRRQKQRELAKARAVSDVKQANVLVCNPTHIAIALRYDDTTPAPVVLSKGVDEIALGDARRGSATRSSDPRKPSLGASAPSLGKDRETDSRRFVRSGGSSDRPRHAARRLAPYSSSPGQLVISYRPAACSMLEPRSSWSRLECSFETPFYVLPSLFYSLPSGFDRGLRPRGSGTARDTGDPTRRRTANPSGASGLAAPEAGEESDAPDRCARGRPSRRQPGRRFGGAR